MNDSHDFDDAPPGTCWVWGMSYTGNLTAEVGQNAAEDALSDECFDLSDNFIEVIRDIPDGGTVSMPSGETKTYICTQDGSADVVMFQREGGSNSKYVYIITSPTLEILGIEPADQHDFDDAPPGTCWVWGMAYTGELTAQVGDNAGNSALSDGCFDLSDNFIEVVRDEPEGGTVATDAGETEINIIVGDGQSDVIDFSHAENSNSLYTYIITDENDNILGIPPSNSNDFEAAGVGICRVWGLAYTGTLLAQVGDNASTSILSDDCFDLSENFVQVTRAMASSARLQLSTLHNLRDEILEISIVNPVRGNLQGVIEIDNPSDFQVQIYDHQGRLMKASSYQNEQYINLNWDVSNLVSGIYTLTVWHEGGLASRRILLQ